MAELLGVKQSSINRYEQGQSAPSLETLVKYADYFDVSMDYLFARTDNPQGKLYEYRPKIAAGSDEMKQFIEMCFDPQSPMSEKLKTDTSSNYGGGQMKGVIYARYSSDNQREESIEGQLRECKEYAERNDIMILGTYIDRALSAKTDNRPEFQHMIKDSAKGLFDVVLVWKLDRFARNRYDSARYKNI